MVSALSIVGFVGVFGALIGYFTFPMAIKFGITYFVNLSQNGMVYPLYMNPPFPSIAAYYLYEITNPR